MRLKEKAGKIAQKGFYGSLPDQFESSGREQFCYMISAGLYPESKVVDLGCGVLRAGYWLIHFLDPDCYFGIESHSGRLKMGLEIIMNKKTLGLKRPKFDLNPNFDTGVFKESFDFFLAYSIWTHASKDQIKLTLDSFRRDGNVGAIFLVSYLPADEQSPDYNGIGWVGSSHESDAIGCIHHSRDWIVTECQNRDIQLTELGTDNTYGQHWLSLRLT